MSINRTHTISGVLVTILYCITSFLYAQDSDTVLTNKGLLWINEDVNAFCVKGHLYNDGDSLYFGERSNAYIDSNFINNRITYTDQFSNLNIRGDFINYGSFTSNWGKVILTNNIKQEIRGSSITHFWDLEIEDTTKTLPHPAKHLKQHCVIHGQLTLNGLEFALDHHNMRITKEGRIENEKKISGFISTNYLEGHLIRSIKKDEEKKIIFPVGSSINGIIKPRRIALKAYSSDTTGDSEYKVQFGNDISGLNTDKKDTAICKINPYFYHKIEKINGDSADISLFFYTDEDDDYWNRIAYWDSSSYEWRLSSTPDRPRFDPTINWTASQTDFSGKYFALAVVYPESISIRGLSEDCINNPAAEYTALGVYGNTSDYYWEVNGIERDEKTQTIPVDWQDPSGIGYGIISVSEIPVSHKCPSILYTHTVITYQKPTADFSYDFDSTSTGLLFAWDVINFTNNSIGHNTSFWDYYDGYSSVDENPSHLFENPGDYDVELIITSLEGCSDTMVKTLNVTNEFIIPGAFSPDGDGINDYFWIKNSGFINFSITIFNRWGMVVFESSDETVHWNGKTFSGEDASTGTYFYVLDAENKDGGFSKKGFISLLRNKN